MFLTFERRIRFACFLFAAIAIGAPAVDAHAQDEEAPYQPVTTQDPRIPVDELRWLLFPLTQEEVQAEADAWRDVLQAKVREIADAEIAQKYAAAQQAEASPAEAVAEAEAEPVEQEPPASETADNQAQIRQNYLQRLATLREERTAILDRMRLVTESLERRGGDATQYTTYMKAVSAIQIDVTDTSATWAMITSWTQSQEGGMRWAKNVAVFLATVIGFWFAAVIVAGIVRRVLNRTRNVGMLMRNFAVKSVRRAVFVLGIIVALSALELNIGPLLAMIGAAGFIVAFALQDTLGNFASGIMILVYRPFDTGDFVEVAGVSGTVANLTIVSVTIITPDNKTIVVPNNSVWGNIITNVTGSKERRVDMTFGIGYQDDMEKAKEIIWRILKEHDAILDDPEPIVQVDALADSSVNIICRPWVKTADYWPVYWAVTQKVKEAFDEAGISIPFPQQDVYLHTMSNDSTP